LTLAVEQAAYEAMRAFRAPFVEIHEITFYLIAVAVVFHLAAVVVTEVHEGGSITSAMFTGRKILSLKPPDVGPLKPEKPSQSKAHLGESG
jgi:cytochrome b